MITSIDQTQIFPASSTIKASSCSNLFSKIASSVARVFMSLKKQFVYTISLGFILFQHYFFPKKFQWYNEIAPHVFLGAIPLENKGHLDFLNKKRVLTFLEPFELEVSIFAKPLTQEIYQKHQILQKHILAEDFRPLKNWQFSEGVSFIEKAVSDKVDVYVHCKAGRGRSAASVVAYLVKNKVFGLTNVDDAIEFVKSKRNQIRLNPHQKAAILDYSLKLSPA